MAERPVFRYQYRAVPVYLALFGAMLVLNFTMRSFEPFSLPLFAAALGCGLQPLVLAAMYILAGGMSVLLCGAAPFFLIAAQGVFLGSVFFIFRRMNRTIRAEFAAVSAVAVLPFVWVYGSRIYGDYLKASAIGAVLFLLCFLFLGAMRCCLFRIGRRRVSSEELVFCASAAAAVGIGLYNCCGAYVYESIALSVLLAAVALIGGGSQMCAVVLGIAPSVCESVAAGEFHLSALAVLCVTAAAALLFYRIGKLPSALGVFLLNVLYHCTADFLLKGVAPFSSGGFYLLMLVPAVPCLLFACVPERLLSRAAEQLHKYTERRLSRAGIDRNRAEVGNRLFEIAAAFREIENTFTALDGGEEDRPSMQSCLLKETVRQVCASCERQSECVCLRRGELEKLVAVGCGKGKVNLIDLPANVSAECINASGLLFALNRLLAESRRQILEEENAAAGRTLFAEQAHALSQMLKDVALSQSSPTGEYSKSEVALRQSLGRVGIACEEILVLGDQPEIYITVCGNFQQKRLCKAVGAALSMPFSLVSQHKVTEDTTVVLLHPTPKFDAAFGIASRTKDGEAACGDTTSVQRISERCFLCALSDGMGSGPYARKVSDCSLSLIESLYRAGMQSETVIAAVNRLLSFNREESFACVDIATVNLDTGRADIFKIGSPLAFLIGASGVEILESDSLPLGILEGVRPTSLSRTLADGDILLFFSDGITAAFGSGADIADYLCRQTCSNPQTLADRLLAEAYSRGNCAADDMTVLAVRLFEKEKSAKKQ